MTRVDTGLKLHMSVRLPTLLVGSAPRRRLRPPVPLPLLRERGKCNHLPTRPWSSLHSQGKGRVKYGSCSKSSLLTPLARELALRLPHVGCRFSTKPPPIQVTTSVKSGRVRPIRNTVKHSMRTDLIDAPIDVLKLLPTLLVIDFNQFYREFVLLLTVAFVLPAGTWVVNPK